MRTMRFDLKAMWRLGYDRHVSHSQTHMWNLENIRNCQSEPMAAEDKDENPDLAGQCSQTRLSFSSCLPEVFWDGLCHKIGTDTMWAWSCFSQFE